MLSFSTWIDFPFVMWMGGLLMWWVLLLGPTTWAVCYIAGAGNSLATLASMAPLDIRKSAAEKEHFPDKAVAAGSDCPSAAEFRLELFAAARAVADVVSDPRPP